MNFAPVENWGTLPDGWRYVEVAGVAVDSKEYIGELGSGMPVTDNTPNIGPRVTVVTRAGERVCRFGGTGEKPGDFTAPHAVVTDSRGDLYVPEVAWTAKGQLLDPPRELRSFQKFRRGVG